MRWVSELVECSLVVCFIFSTSCSPVQFNKNNTVHDSCQQCDAETLSLDYKVDAQSQAIDIVFVIDNSPSMQIDLNHLGQKFSSFVGGLKDKDWQACLLSTDAIFFEDELISVSGQNKLITPGADSVYQFKSGISNIPIQDQLVHGNLAGVEQGIASIGAFIKGSSRQLCLREKSAKAFILVSDEDELDDGWISEQSPYFPQNRNLPTTLIDELSRNFDQRASVHLVGIMPGDDSCLEAQRSQLDTYTKEAGYFAHRYSELVEATKGTKQSICAPDYGQVLSKISKGIIQRVNSIELSCSSPSSVNLEFVSGEGVPWEVIGSTIVFNQALQPGDHLRISYQCVENI